MCKLYNPERFGNNLRRIRKEKGISGEALAAALGIEAGEIAAWEFEADCPQMDLLVRVCSILECDMAKMLA